MLLLSKKNGIYGNNYLDREFDITMIGINTSIYLPVSEFSVNHVDTDFAKKKISPRRRPCNELMSSLDQSHAR